LKKAVAINVNVFTTRFVSFSKSELDESTHGVDARQAAAAIRTTWEPTLLQKAEVANTSGSRTSVADNNPAPRNRRNLQPAADNELDALLLRD